MAKLQNKLSILFLSGLHFHHAVLCRPKVLCVRTGCAAANDEKANHAVNKQTKSSYSYPLSQLSPSSLPTFQLSIYPSIYLALYASAYIPWIFKAGNGCPLEIHSAARWAVDIVDNDDNNQHSDDDDDTDGRWCRWCAYNMLNGRFFTMPASIIKFLIFMSRRNRYK